MNEFGILLGIYGGLFAAVYFMDRIAKKKEMELNDDECCGGGCCNKGDHDGCCGKCHDHGEGCCGGGCCNKENK